MNGPVTPTAAASVADRPVPLEAVRFAPEGMLGAWQSRNAAATLPHCIAQLEAGGALPNMRRVIGEYDGPFVGFQFSDSDIYKVLEAVGWEAGRSDISALLPWVDETVALLQRAQRADGYLNSHFQVDAPDRVFADLRWGHELYCLGHLLQAGVAWARTVGRTDILEIGLRFAALVDERFGPAGEEGVCGHAEIETALVEVHRVTGDERWLRLAEVFVDRRGHHSVGEDRFGYHYFQDHTPVREVTDATGHAVRQLYLAAGVADVAAETGERALLEADERIWSSAFGEKQYITGGLGSRHRDEAFGDPFELPPDRAYAETCAAIAGFQFSWRMLLATGDSRYADEMERALVNAIAESTSLDGTCFFYSSPLQLRTHRDGVHEQAPSERASWYECACCPPNLARLLSSLHGYAATVADGRLRLQLIADCSIDLRAAGVGAGSLHVRTGYPWDGDVLLQFDEPFAGRLEVRRPAWATDASVDGLPVTDAGYLVLDGSSAPLTEVRISFGMPVVVRTPHPHIDAARGTVAVTRGPAVYCLEQADLPAGVVLEDVVVDPAAAWVVDAAPIPASGWTAPALRGRARARTPDAGETYPAWHPSAPAGGEPGAKPIDVRLIPYALWGNREPGAMRVWLPTQ
ncbi:glycoside hydrolase family 127 protein [Microbacterium sp. NPDC057650]|uniref:glycoside hydrolase family 127 protein n=1 Tax=unclassified Microbacterium TaxID=2609290 RepID=UPI00366C2F00